MVQIIDRAKVSESYKKFRERGVVLGTLKELTQAEEASPAYQKALTLAAMYTEAELRMAVSMRAAYIRSNKGGK